MAANVLNSPRATQMSVFVVRAFVKMRSIFKNSRQLADKLALLEQELKIRLNIHEAAIVDGRMGATELSSACSQFHRTGRVTSWSCMWRRLANPSPVGRSLSAHGNTGTVGAGLENLQNLPRTARTASVAGT
jgi:hypothetical protein